MKNITKIMRVGSLNGERNADLFIKASITDGKLSISGVIGPTMNGNSTGGCGQIDMEFEHRNPDQNDKRYSNPVKPGEIKFAPAWSEKLWLDLLEVWHDWHLNDMRSGCEHQRKLGWTYEDHHDKKTFKGENCPVCGYSIGSAWLSEPLPSHVEKFIAALPDADKSPAWV